MDISDRNKRALSVFRRIIAEWGFDDDVAAQLLGTEITTLQGWLDESALDLQEQTLERLSHLFGIYKDLQILLPHKDRVREWLTHPNAGPIFQGAKPLAVMQSSSVEGLRNVHEFLDSEIWG